MLSLKKIIVIACSTGGPKALQEIIPFLDERINCPVIIVQHMTAGFTKTLAGRLNLISKIPVTESTDCELLENNHIYIAHAGKHLNIDKAGVNHRIEHSDEGLRLGVKPCANFTFESLAGCDFDEVICVVLTGMGSDGAEGIIHLKKYKQIKVLIQDEESSVVYGMPGSILKAGIDCKVVKLCDMGKEIVALTEG